MSKQSYMAGFCKAAESNGVDPKALAAFAVEKAAQEAAAAGAAPAAGAAGGESGVWKNVLDAINKAKAAAKGAAKSTKDWYGKQNAATKALIGAGLGSAVGTGLGAAVVGKKGLRSGSILGALAGAGASQVDWKALAEHFGQIKKNDAAARAVKTVTEATKGQETK